MDRAKQPGFCRHGVTAVSSVAASSGAPVGASVTGAEGGASGSVVGGLLGMSDTDGVGVMSAGALGSDGETVGSSEALGFGEVVVDVGDGVDDGVSDGVLSCRGDAGSAGTTTGCFDGAAGRGLLSVFSGWLTLGGCANFGRLWGLKTKSVTYMLVRKSAHREVTTNTSQTGLSIFGRRMEVLRRSVCTQRCNTRSRCSDMVGSAVISLGLKPSWPGGLARGVQMSPSGSLRVALERLRVLDTLFLCRGGASK
jgi:hypothetical protein